MRIPIDLPAWKALASHAPTIPPMRELFAKDPNRASTLSHRWNDLFIDYSKNRVTPETPKLLRQLLKETKVDELRDRMFRGEKWLAGSVIDFIDLQWFPVFNIADSAVTLGAAMLITSSFAASRTKLQS